jgi:hypothetical protein
MADHLAEISDDPDDRGSDYGRGWEAGARTMAARLRGEMDGLRVAHELRGLFSGALAYQGAVASIDSALVDLGNRDS